ncbi:L,D-transpeptidase family protein [Elizabethkingia argentiflava]|uniref:L,D-transpeptidase family protein n=1 Tax=Elizabethkingia argenteiflava TaxID=2681556 RepID=A0A845Q1A7_9FLAO|nr:L,D-transpeptidase [Elizabethkingia argenteiflava]NAW52110.1 L,D-transpeptidase family protein [Elizabethkingia argenteiflava]
MRERFNLGMGILVIFFVLQCSKKNKVIAAGPNDQVPLSSMVEEGPSPHSTETEATKKDSVHTLGDVQNLTKKTITYRPWNIKGNDSLKKAFLKTYTGLDLHSILALNRLDRKNMYRADTLIVPDQLEPDFLAYSPFPYSVRTINTIPKIAFFSYPLQAYVLYEYGKQVKWGPTSMGSKIYQTPRGLYFTNWKGKEIISTVSDEWKLKWNFNIANYEGIGWHQYNLPGYPASHSCLRLLEEDAKWLYNWADQWILNKGGASVRAKGTPVVVYGEYPWGKRKPWRQLLENPTSNDLSEEKLTQIVSPYLIEIKKEQNNRQKVLEEIKEGAAKNIQQDSIKPEKKLLGFLFYR